MMAYFPSAENSTEKKNPLSVSCQSLPCDMGMKMRPLQVLNEKVTRKQVCHRSAKMRELADYGIPLPCVRFGVRSSG